MARGIAAITALATEAGGLGAEKVIAVATSAVRDASNGQEFRKRVAAETGLEIRILAGAEEASLIGRGLLTDPSLADLRDFHLYDLGGGSLECLSFRDRAVERAVSLPLGCVRLTEKYVPRPSGPFDEASAGEIARQVTDALLRSGFALPVPPGVAVVGTGGTLATVRAMVAAGRGAPIGGPDPLIKVSLLREILATVGPLDAEGRGRIPGLPGARSDVFPAALATLLALAGVGGIEGFRYSIRNLRWGLAAEFFG
jgi:exopolyphosphatase/guanosine-5'-triphosphate,3'-diphosphate pyrophosphatase